MEITELTKCKKKKKRHDDSLKGTLRYHQVYEHSTYKHDDSLKGTLRYHQVYNIQLINRRIRQRQRGTEHI